MALNLQIDGDMKANLTSCLLLFALANSLLPIVVHAEPQVTLPVLTSTPLPAKVPAASPSLQPDEWAKLLEQAVPNNPALLSSVISLMNKGSDAKDPAVRNP